MYYNLKEIKDGNKLIAKVFKYSTKKFKGIKFFTPSNLSFQVGLMSHPSKHKIHPHFHLNRKKIIKYMSEFLIIFKGKLKVNFFNKKKKKFKSIILKKRDMILLITGSHGFEVLEKVEMIEVKQGPFSNKKDKIRF